MITTTLNRIREHSPCQNGWEKLLKGLGKTKPDDEPLPFAKILEINGLYDALWCCRVEPQYAKEWRLFAIWCARQVQHLMTDQRSLDALDVAERYANGEAIGDELAAARAAAEAATLDAARAAAWDAAWDARAAAGAAGLTAAWAATAGAATARAAAGTAAWDAAEAAARAAAWDARAAAGAATAGAAAWDAAWDAAWAAAWAAQKKKFLEIVGG